MREIKFRGKSTSTKWLYGNLLTYTVNGVLWAKIWENDEDGKLGGKRSYTVEPRTVGQYTGLTDKNGVEVYEGDILSRNNAQFPMRGPVEYENGSFFFHDEELGFCWYPLHGIAKQGTGTLNDLEVIGNIHDNPELLGDAPSC